MNPQLQRGCWATGVDGFKMLLLKDWMQWSIKTLSSQLGSKCQDLICCSFILWSSLVQWHCCGSKRQVFGNCNPGFGLHCSGTSSLGYSTLMLQFLFCKYLIWIPFLPLRECSRCISWHVVFSRCVAEWKKSWLWMCLCREVTAISMPSRMCFDFFFCGTPV